MRWEQVYHVCSNTHGVYNSYLHSPSIEAEVRFICVTTSVKFLTRG
jgi:hypothetical protein